MARLVFGFNETPCAVSVYSSIGWTGIVRRRVRCSVSVGPGCYRAAFPFSVVAEHGYTF